MSLKNILEIIFEELNESSLKCMMQEYCDDITEIALDNQLIVYEVLDQYGGEDQGSDYWCVWKFTKDGEECFIKFHGWYASNYGSDYHGWKFVTPKEKTIIAYE